jgi:DNA-binding NarL/FixJ family response regulator
LLASQPDFEVVADCGSVEETLEVLRREPIDLVLLDFDLGQEHGSRVITACRGTHLTTRVLMVTAGMTAAESATALVLGASGIFLKQGSPRALERAIRLVAGGAMWVDEGIIQEMAKQIDLRQGPRERPHTTEREEHVLHGILEGLANKEIGVRLGVSESGVKAVLQQLFRKFGVHTRGQLVRIALEGVATTSKPWDRTGVRTSDTARWPVETKAS